MRTINDWWKPLAVVVEFQFLGVFTPRQDILLEDLFNHMSVAGVNLGATL